MAICIFPGTFNPIHEAHLRMANFALQNYGFEKIIFITFYFYVMIIIYVSELQMSLCSNLRHILNLIILASYNHSFENVQ